MFRGDGLMNKTRYFLLTFIEIILIILIFLSIAILIPVPNLYEIKKANYENFLRIKYTGYFLAIWFFIALIYINKKIKKSKSIIGSIAHLIKRKQV